MSLRHGQRASGSRKRVEGRLVEVSAELRRLRADLAVTAEHRTHFAELAEDARLRALVSESPQAEREHRDAQRQVEVVQRQYDHLQSEVSRLESTQDELLDQLTAGD